jgi:hypothetical protein
MFNYLWGVWVALTQQVPGTIANPVSSDHTTCEEVKRKDGLKISFKN